MKRGRTDAGPASKMAWPCVFMNDVSDLVGSIVRTRLWTQFEGCYVVQGTELMSENWLERAIHSPNLMPQRPPSLLEASWSQPRPYRLERLLQRTGMQMTPVEEAVTMSVNGAPILYASEGGPRPGGEPDPVVAAVQMPAASPAPQEAMEA
jgi:hypothetical protein